VGFAFVSSCVGEVVVSFFVNFAQGAINTPSDVKTHETVKQLRLAVTLPMLVRPKSNHNCTLVLVLNT
jgi:hypothetical protein